MYRKSSLLWFLLSFLLRAFNMFESPMPVTNWTGFSFKGRLDLNKVAIVGHSFGGATTAMSLAKDKRFR